MAIIAGLPQRLLGHPNETYLPTFQDSQGTYPWLSGSHENAWRPGSHQRPPRQGSQTSGCLIKSDRLCDPRSLRGRCCLVLRLKTRSQFQAVLAGNRLASSVHFAVHHLLLDEAAKVQDGGPAGHGFRRPVFPASDIVLGVMVPKRWAKRAVTRNAIKRQIYSVARAFETSMPKGAFVVRLKMGLNKTLFSSASSEAMKEAVRLELQQLFARVRPSSTPMSSPSLLK